MAEPRNNQSNDDLMEKLVAVNRVARKNLKILLKRRGK